MLSCQTIDDFMDAYIAGDLPFFMSLSFKIHIMICSRCRIYMKQYIAALDAVKSNKDQLKLSDQNVSKDMPPELAELILKHIPSAK
ncbi:MAG: hypothetical protein AAF621_08235 [Pseudomonadota bacterium]